MAKPPPPAVVSVTEAARTGLDVLKRSLVPAPFALLDSINDFWGFHVVYTLAELKAVDALLAGPRSAEAMARDLGVDGDLLYRVLRAGTLLGIVEELPHRSFALKPIGRALCATTEASFRDFVIFQGRHGTRFWRLLPECVRHGKTAIEIETGQKPFDYFTSNPEIADVFNRAMTATSNLAVDAFVAVYDLSFASTIVDIGGGHGRLLSGLLRAAPRARGVLFDLPSVVAGAPAVFDAAGVTDRVQVVGGSFFDSVPAGDCYVAKSIIHDWDDADARKILSNVRRSMTPSGRVLLYEAIVGPPNKASFAKFLDLEMIVNAGGRERTEAEYGALFASAGLKLERIVPAAGPLSILEARAS